MKGILLVEMWMTENVEHMGVQPTCKQPFLRENSTLAKR